MKQKTLYEEGKVEGMDPNHMAKSAQYEAQHKYKNASEEDKATKQFFPILEVENFIDQAKI